MGSRDGGRSSVPIRGFLFCIPIPPILCALYLLILAHKSPIYFQTNKSYCGESQYKVDMDSAQYHAKRLILVGKGRWARWGGGAVRWGDREKGSMGIWGEKGRWKGWRKWKGKGWGGGGATFRPDIGFASLFMLIHDLLPYSLFLCQERVA